MTTEFYKLMHLLGIVIMFSGLVGLLTLKMAGTPVEGKMKSFVHMSHGIGLLFILVGGFGMLAKLGLMQDLPLWVYGKLLIWLIFGGLIALVKRKASLGFPIFSLLVSLFLISGWLALYKPF